MKGCTAIGEDVGNGAGGKQDEDAAETVTIRAKDMRNAHSGHERAMSDARALTEAS